MSINSNDYSMAGRNRSYTSPASAFHTKYSTEVVPPPTMAKQISVQGNGSFQTIPESGVKTNGLHLHTKNFLSATMPQVVAASSFASLIWLAFYLFFFSILALQAFLTLQDYYSYPVNVEFSIETSSTPLEFPAVTVCNNNIVRKSSIARIPKYAELASLSDFVYQQILPEANRDHRHLFSLGLHQCNDDPSTWIPKSWVCDGKQDCSDSSDESVELCSSHKALNHSESCLDEFEKCPGESTCAVLCDGVNDCVLEPGYDESMEKGCRPSEGTSYYIAQPEPQTLSSPNYPKIYSNNLDETYIIEAPEGLAIQLQIMKFHVEECDRKSCSCDYLTIQDGDGSFFEFNGSSKMCGEMCAFSRIESSTNTMKLKFSTDFSNSNEGWSLEYSAIPRTARIPLPGYFYQVLFLTLCNRDQIPDGIATESPPDYPGGNPDYLTGMVEPDFISLDVMITKSTGLYDWYSVYQISKMPDFSDFKKFVKFEKEELIGNGHQGEDFITQCVFDREICNKTAFKDFQHETYGNCFTFNSALGVNGTKIETKFTSKSGSEDGLSLSLFLEIDEYLGVLGQKSGVTVAVHNSDESASLLSRSMLLNAGTATRITLQQQTVSRQSYPFSDCTEKWPGFLELNEIYQNFRYTMEFCQFICQQKTIAEVCGCSDTFDWNFSRNEEILQRAQQKCDVWNSTQYGCMVSVYTEYSRGYRFCDCPNSCSDKSFQMKVSTASWPSLSYTPHFVSLMKRSKSSKVRKLINQLLTDAYTDDSSKARLQEQISRNFVRLEVHFETMVYQKVKETPKYNLSTLFGTIGGNLGLWLGWSILSLIEFLQWIGMTAIYLLVDRKKQKRAKKGSEQPHDPYS